MSVSPQDLCDSSDALKAREVTFTLSPLQWEKFCSSNKLTSEWAEVALHPSGRPDVPKRSGLYSIILDPQVGGHPNNGYLMYLGQTINLHRRIGEYLGVEKNRVKRPRVNRLLNIYEKYLKFVYVETNIDDLDDVENDFLRAHIPPCCDEDELPADLRKPAKAAF